MHTRIFEFGGFVSQSTSRRGNWGFRIKNIVSLSRSAGQGRWSFKTVTAVLLFGAIILVFVLFGFPTREVGGTSYVAQVNNVFISLRDLRRQVSQFEQYYSQLMGGSGNMDAQRQFLTAQSLETLIDQELLAQAAVKNRVLVSDEEVRRIIMQEMPMFQAEGRFSKERYLGLLQANELTPAEFESGIRKTTATQRLRSLFEKATKPLKLETDKLSALQNQQMKLQYFTWTAEDLEKKINVSPEQSAQALTQEAFRQRVQAEYAANASSLGQPEKIQVRHLLIKFSPGNAAERESAQKKIVQLKEQANDANFGDLIRQNSQDFNAQKTGGELGWLEHGRMPEQFDQVAFSTPVRTISGPVETPSGFHLIQVLDKKASVKPSLESVQGNLARSLLARDQIQEQVQKLNSMLKSGDSAGVLEWLQKMKLTPKETDWFDLAADAVPGLNSQQVFTELKGVTSQKPWVSKVLQEAGQSAIVKFKETRVKPTETAQKGTKNVEPASNPSNFSQNRGAEVFRDWMMQSKKQARISRNLQQQ